MKFFNPRDNKYYDDKTIDYRNLTIQEDDNIKETPLIEHDLKKYKDFIKKNYKPKGKNYTHDNYYKVNDLKARQKLVYDIV